MVNVLVQALLGLVPFFLLVSDRKDLFIDLLISESLTQGMNFFGDGLHYLNNAKSVARLASFFTTCEPHHLSLCGCFKPLDRWNTVTAIVLLNVLISLFSSAYSDVNAHIFLFNQSDHNMLSGC